MPDDARASRRPTPRTLAMGALALAAVALFAVLVPVLVSLYGQPPLFAFLSGAVMCGTPLLALSHPRWAAAAFVASALLMPLPSSAAAAAVWPWPWSVPAMLAFFLLVGVLALQHGWRIALTTWLASIAVTFSVVLGMSAVVPVLPAIVNLVIVTSISGAVLLVATLAASRLKVGAELTREREVSALEQSRRVLVEERARIARELHDVVAHGMSLIQVQASTARYRVADLPESAVAEFDDIAATARAGLTEMRRLLGVLRTEEQPTELAPQQGVADIATLVEAAKRAGADVAFAASGTTAGIPPAVDIAAFRIVQEALSNAIRHAPRTRIAVAVDVTHDEVTVRVRNEPATPPPAPAPPGGGRGHGLLGMRERAALVGGTVEAGPDADGGWTVRAALPTAAAPEEAA